MFASSTPNILPLFSGRVFAVETSRVEDEDIGPWAVNLEEDNARSNAGVVSPKNTDTLNLFMFFSCGVVAVGPGVKLVEDKSKPYPDCCPRPEKS